MLSTAEDKQLANYLAFMLDVNIYLAHANWIPVEEKNGMWQWRRANDAETRTTREALRIQMTKDWELEEA